jgi:hypothetical protein
MSPRQSFRFGFVGTSAVVLVLAATLLAATPSASRSVEVEALVDRIARTHGLDARQRAELLAIFRSSTMLGQGNARVSEHPMTPEQCRAREAAVGVHFDDASFLRICGQPYMAPLYDPVTERAEDAKVCIDQLEFPNVPCEYPIVWVRAAEAAEICRAMGKRLCDAHEWEGACAGALHPPDYDFDLARGVAPVTAVERMRSEHNRSVSSSERTWSYGPVYQKGVCATGSGKSPGCNGGSWADCGSNTYPAGSFPACRSALGVYDLNGNAAEHMNLPLAPDQMASRGSASLGVTEMKGSWFVFDAFRAHEDWCRWRAPYWHGSRVMDPESHRNYHLGFRCCKSLE